MTTEYMPGEENIYITVAPRADGNVSFGVWDAKTEQRIYGIVLPPETARNAAQNLTLASFKAEEYKKWVDDQREQ